MLPALVTRKKVWCIGILIMLGASSLKAQNKRITIDFQNSYLESALTKLVTDLNIPLSFNPALLPPNKRINKKFVNSTVNEILDYLLSETDLSYKYSGNEFIIIKDKNKLIVLSGHLKDLESREDIIGGSLYIKSLDKAVATNNYGYYAIVVPRGDYMILISHIGYKKKTVFFSLTSSQQVDIALEKQIDTLKEIPVNVYGSSSDTLLSATLGKSLSKDFINKHQSLGGEADIIKSMQMQNGIVGITEGSSSLFIRGGNKDQNLIMIDEATIYNPAHLFGLVSIFNPDAISNVQIYKDEIPANFGGRLSSVIDNNMLEGDKQSFHIKGGVSFLSARVSVEGPIVRDKGSFLVTFRRGLTDFINNNFQLFNLKATYYDLNVKFNYNLNSNNRIFYSTYYGFDQLFSTNTYRNNWGNKTSTLRWNHLFSSQLFSNLSVIYSNYKNQLDIDANQVGNKFTWITGIEDIGLKVDFTYYYKPESNIKFGFNAISHKFIPGESPNRINDSIPVNISREDAIECAVYISHNLIIGNKFQINYGLRASMFQSTKNQTFSLNTDSTINLNGSSKTFINLEPRLFVRLKLNKFQQLHFAYNRNYQYLQLIQDDELSFSSLESWIPSSSIIAPQKADFFSLGYKISFSGFNVSLDGYYKKMYNQLDLIDHAQIILNPIIESQLRAGKSDAYGTEFNILKTWKKVSGNLSYTYSSIYKTTTDINNNKPYQANYNIPHDFKMTLSYQLASRLSLNSFFTYKTGRPVTLPVGYYIQDGNKIPIFEDRNSSRFPDYSRLDLSVVLKPRPLKLNTHHWQSTWSFSVYNVYNKRNQLFYSINQGPTLNNIGSGIVPSITYNFRF